MYDRERVIRKLEELLEYSRYNDSVGWNPDSDTETLRDAIAMLKAQKPYRKGYWINPLSTDCSCSECGNQPEHEPGESVPLYDYCPYCGAEMEVKWE